ncbi:hypothetical protein NUM3379_35200 [Kineococcus sp. NUM-3379]
MKGHRFKDDPLMLTLKVVDDMVGHVNGRAVQAGSRSVHRNLIGTAATFAASVGRPLPAVAEDDRGRVHLVIAADGSVRVLHPRRQDTSRWTSDVRPAAVDAVPAPTPPARDSTESRGGGSKRPPHYGDRSTYYYDAGRGIGAEDPQSPPGDEPAPSDMATAAGVPDAVLSQAAKALGIDPQALAQVLAASRQEAEEAPSSSAPPA